MLLINNSYGAKKKKIDKWEMVGVIMCWIFIILGLVMTCVKFIVKLPRALIPKHHPRE